MSNERANSGGPPLLVTGLPRSGTSWVGKMLQCSGDVVYVNEPMNPGHPPGHSPGVLNAEVKHRFHYIDPDDDGEWRAAFARTVALRYNIPAELRRNRGLYDLARMVKYATAFTGGRLTRKRALLDDPFALYNSRWLARTVQCRVVILVRDPVSYVGSWEKLGWSPAIDQWLAQPALLRDLIGERAEELRSVAESAERLERTAMFWRTAYDVVDEHFRGQDGILLVRYEDFASEPLKAFERLYASLGLTWSERARDRIAQATSGEAPKREFSWSLRGGVSRTAFQPMDSRVAIARARGRLAPETVARVWARTGDVAARFGYSGEGELGPFSG